MISNIEHIKNYYLLFDGRVTHVVVPHFQGRVMGIQGLLPLLKPITKTVHVRELRGCRVAVDAYVWLHRGAYGCAADLCQGRDTTRYLNYCIERAKIFLEHGVNLYIVFDGSNLPAKRATEDERRAKRVSLGAITHFHQSWHQRWSRFSRFVLHIYYDA